MKKTQDQLSAYPEKHREATEGAVRLVEKCSEVDLSIVILWKVVHCGQQASVRPLWLLFILQFKTGSFCLAQVGFKLCTLALAL